MRRSIIASAAGLVIVASTPAAAQLAGDDSGVKVRHPSVMRNLVPAERLEKAALAPGKRLPVLIEVKLSHEETKHGIAPTELAGTVERTLALSEVARLRKRLVPEHSIFGHENTATGEKESEGEDQSGRAHRRKAAVGDHGG